MYLEIMKKKKKTTWVILNYSTLKQFGGQKKNLMRLLNTI